MAADGSGPVNLTRNPGTDGHPRVSPDGRCIYFNSNRSSDPATFVRGTMDREHNHEIYSMALDGGDVRRVPGLPDWDTYPAPSPDGTQLRWRRIAPAGGKSESGRNSEVFWMNLATGEMRDVTGHQAYDIYVANPDGSNPVRVTFGDGVDGTGSWTKPGFSADGKRILCTRTVGSSVDIFVIELR